MTVSDTYGTNSYTAKELAGLLADRLDVTFTERESDYLGVYFLATLADTTRLQIQPNAIPGDDGEDDLYDDEYPDMSALLLITSPAAAEPLSDELSAVGELTKIRSTRS
ncbi:hypothetical protein OG980_30310 [Streptomyces albidoflavus]|uniref:hypothetical protein n=1 Tax=Streptomyces albidoflavus TaxID=1886 RepID=UPI002256B3F7|nr:hypothetical protein [Streptomyces albidoflavus]MCX4468417.1 hypothetical protein [Streptomyces albidoflavus]WSI96368.1 hypothetical protein OG695_31195 [Streptomyces albidoflavus]